MMLSKLSRFVSWIFYIVSMIFMLLFSLFAWLGCEFDSISFILEERKNLKH